MDPDMNILLKNETPNTNHIPKIIWSFWDNDKLPPIIESCVNSWKLHNPDFEIIILNTNNYKTYLPDFDIENHKNLSDFVQRKSDILRLNLLKKYGGIWLDSTIICNKSLQWILDKQQQYKVEYVGFYMQAFNTAELVEKSPMIENWFIACVKDSQFMNDWCDEVMSISNYNSVDEYLETTINNGVSIQRMQSPTYLICHVCVQKLLQKQTQNTYNIYVISAASSKLGPFYYQYDNSSSVHWDIEKSIPRLINGDYNYFPLLKIRGPDRHYIEENNLDYRKLFKV
jgi:hypothetical protein